MGNFGTFVKIDGLCQAQYDAISAIRDSLRRRKDEWYAARHVHHYLCPKHGTQLEWLLPGEEPHNRCPQCEAERAERAEYENRFKKPFVEAKERFLMLSGEIVCPQMTECTFENFEAVTAEQMRDLTQSRGFAERFMSRLEHPDEEPAPWRGLLLIGKSGTGKSHLASAIYGSLTSQGFAPLYTSAHSFFEALRNSSCRGAIVNAASRLSVLMLDELGRSAASDYETNALLEVLDARKRSRLPTVFIANLDAKDYARIMGPAVTSRTGELMKALLFTGIDYRRSKSAKDIDF